jgi:hypothetical protein
MATVKLFTMAVILALDSVDSEVRTSGQQLVSSMFLKKQVLQHNDPGGASPWI